MTHLLLAFESKYDGKGLRSVKASRLLLVEALEKRLVSLGCMYRLWIKLRSLTLEGLCLTFEGLEDWVSY